MIELPEDWGTMPPEDKLHWLYNQREACDALVKTGVQDRMTIDRRITETIKEAL